jgi:hypothetical protein
MADADRPGAQKAWEREFAEKPGRRENGVIQKLGLEKDDMQVDEKATQCTARVARVTARV